MALFKRKKRLHETTPPIPHIDRDEPRQIKDCGDEPLDLSTRQSNDSVYGAQGIATNTNPIDIEVQQTEVNEQEEIEEQEETEEQVIPQEIIDFKNKFISGMTALHKKWNKNKYNFMKNSLYELNEKLDEFDTDCKNKLDKEEYEKLGNLEQTIFLIGDIFDNYRLDLQEQVYPKELTTRINNSLININTLENITWLQELLFGLELL